MRDDEARTLMHEKSLGRVVDDLIRRAGPTVRIYLEPAEENVLPLGGSKLGGMPDLPKGMDWPSWHRPMAFIGQLNLVDATRAAPNTPLPADGLLSFFFETDGELLYAARLEQPDTPLGELGYRNDRRAWRVLRLPSDASQLERRPLPDGVHPRTHYRACATRFIAEVTLPYPDDPVLDGLVLTREEESALLDLLYEPKRPFNRGTFAEGGHHLLGYPYLPGSEDPRVFVAQCAAAERKESAGPREEAMRRWQLLLQVDSSADTHMDWAGGGLIHWCIERDPLLRRDFSNIWVNMQFL